MSTTLPDRSHPVTLVADWTIPPPARAYRELPLPRPPFKTFLLACTLFFLTLCTCLVAGTQFAHAYAQNKAMDTELFVSSFSLLYRDPSALLAGLPFALTLLTILLTHELGHFFACRHHRIYSTYPFFIPFPSPIGTFGAFIMIRSPIRTTRALFDVGASGPFAGLIFAIPALAYGVLHSHFVPGLSSVADNDVVFGVPLLMQLFSRIFHPGQPAADLLLNPIGRAAWVGLLATSLNLLPVGQLDGGHILRSVSPRAHRLISLVLPLFLIFLGYARHWAGWYVWGALLFGLRFFRTNPIYESIPLDPKRQLGAILALLFFLLCFMPAPIRSF